MRAITFTMKYFGLEWNLSLSILQRNSIDENFSPFMFSCSVYVKNKLGTFAAITIFLITFTTMEEKK